MGETTLRARFEAVADLAGTDFEPPSLESLAQRRRGRRTTRLSMAAAVATIVAVAVVATHLGGTPGPSSGRITTPGVAVDAGHVTVSQLTHYRWTTMPDAPISAARDYGIVSVWTGNRMIVWGGASQKTGHLYNDGASYDPATRTWQRLPASPLSPRQGAAFAWTGSKLFVWGGAARSVPIPNGALYDPITRTWQSLPPLDVAGAANATAVWTGRDVVLFTTAFRSRSAQVHAYNPADNSWTTLPNITISQTELLDLEALEVGPTLYVWAAVQTSIPHGLQTGNVAFVYSPDTNSWKPTDLLPARDGFSVGPPAWTGDHILFGPAGVECDTCSGFPGVSTGTWADPRTGRLTTIAQWPFEGIIGAESFSWTGAAVLALGSGTHTATWDPATQTWTRLLSSPYQGDSAVQVWTGNELIVWGQLYAPPSPNPNAGSAQPVREPTGLEFRRP